MAFPLPTLTYYRMPDQYATAATIAGLLDAIYAAVTSAVDYRGRTLASTHVWTWARYQNAGTTEAVYASAAPAGTPMTQVPQLILCGTAAGPALTMATPDTAGGAGANMLFAGINKNGGAYNAYTAASPFTAGSFFGYWRAAGAAILAVTPFVRAFIGQEAIFLQIVSDSDTTAQVWLAMGALYAPLDSDTATSAETDNRQYGMIVNGSSVYVPTDIFSNTGSTIFFRHGGVDGQSHNGIFTPGAGTIIVGAMREVLLAGPTNPAACDASGTFVGDRIDFCAGASGDGNKRGAFRSAYITGYRPSGMPIRNGTSDLFHLVTMSLGHGNSGLILKAVS